MQAPPEVNFKNMDVSPHMMGLIEARIVKLERIFDRITTCHVHVAMPHRQYRTGHRYEVTIEVRVPGTELVVNDDPGDADAHGDLRIAVRDAFDAMERQLKKWKQKASGETKTHAGSLQGRIAEIDKERGFGQIAAADGRLVYFHRNSVIGGDFNQLALRDPVELVVQTKESDIGPQASTVRRITEAKVDT